MDVDYNPIRLKLMPCTLYLTHPENPSTTIRYLIRPPRLRSDLAPWWRTAIIVKSPTSLPFPSMSAHNHAIAQGSLLQALTHGMEMANSDLSSFDITTPDYLNTPPTLLPT